MLSLGPTVNAAMETISYITLPISISSKQPSQNIYQNLTALKLSYTSLLKIFENLKLILESASSRSTNWQRFCLQNPSTIQYFIELALLMGVDSNGSGSDSSNLSGSSSISSAFTPAIVPTILQCIVYCLGSNSSSSKTAPIAQPHQISLGKAPIAVNNNFQTQKVINKFTCFFFLYKLQCRYKVGKIQEFSVMDANMVYEINLILNNS